MTFKDWIEEVEDDEDRQVRGLMHCILDHRTALKAAFDAGAQSAEDPADVSEFMGAWDD